MNKSLTGSWLKHWDFILFDLVLLEAAYALTCSARYGWQNPYCNDLYLSTGIVVLLLGICAAYLLEDYTGIMRRGKFQEFLSVARYVIFVCVCELVYLYMTKNADIFSRGAYLTFAVVSMAMIYIERILWKTYLLKHHKIFYKKKGMLILTTVALAEETVTHAQENTYNELAILGVILLDDDTRTGKEIAGVKVVCTIDELQDYILANWADCILVNADKEAGIPTDLLEHIIEMGLTIHRKISDASDSTGRQQIEKIAGCMVLSTSMHIVSARQMVMKRIMDICGGLVGMLLTIILVIIFGPAIYISSPGPIFFSQERVGRNGRRFKIYKFRSMYMDAEQRKQELMDKNQMNGLMFKLDADPRIIGSGPDGTRKGLGWFIRKTSIDEFPQFWNVLKGDMSLVGTRPPTVDEWNQYEYHHRGRLAIKPGMTGLWQVSGRSDITDFEEVVRLDKEYIKNWNIGQDIRILFKTIDVVIRGAGSK